VMSREQPVEKRSARSADVQITGWRERNERGRQSSLTVILSESEGSRKSSITCEIPRSARDDELVYAF
jgi:hypothetical protein